MKLYTFPPSPNARKTVAVVAHLGITDVEHTLVRLHKGEHRQPDYLAINPMGKVPVGRNFLLGDDVTLADFVVAGAATYVERGKIPVGFYPHVKAWWDRLNAIEAWSSTMPGHELP